ncbi:hypothetical protein GTA08_BOTSDO00591 [Neofusicoccum parvum]|uniref:Uncharacterized protein n=1 Tax=Neofusicoccum parvum TaxID=310453 RepID=A0ACB5SKV3_9PEZI|nr:hypothetical protein GTA08_BOTSDO00591 [Neofusicoccum parvum]
MLDPNDGVVSENFRTCFCGDQKTTDDGSWPSCANCVKNKGMESIYANLENTDIVRFCATPDPNLYLWLTNFLNFTLTTNPSALASPSPILTGPITAISTLASAYSADPSANIIPSGIFHLTTDTVSTLPPHPTASTSHSQPNNPDNTSGSGDSDSGAQTTPAGTGDAVLTVLYYTDSATSMYVVGPARELASLTAASLPASGTEPAAALAGARC